MKIESQLSAARDRASRARSSATKCASWADDPPDAASKKLWKRIAAMMEEAALGAERCVSIIEKRAEEQKRATTVV